ncbi:sulfotransferase domain-containing protein [Salinibacter ruber]|uniref:sulfotransferase domain-containing protein n=1 Tax=Salinibacter ruber TaxID=146919 RepID=UPI00216A6BAB|nr:sulfotransferase domain-containing protein [Salinibacter ruber]MCS4174840.1 hypothetical protein [Salinibacter ruber]
MLVVSNGAFKSGSTWLFNIARSITQFPPPPESYLNPEWENPSIHPNELKALLAEEPLEEVDYLVKNHFGSRDERDLLLKNEHVRVLNITRDLRDVVVSAYYHYRREEGYDVPFKQYYWKRGRYVAKKVREYHSVWDVPSSRVYLSSFKELKKNFAEECERIGALLGYELSVTQIQNVKDETSIQSLRKAYDNDDFFRNGKRGDWQNHLTARMEKDVSRIADRAGIESFSVAGWVDRVWAEMISWTK